jgi:hypothetical protein
VGGTTLQLIDCEKTQVVKQQENENLKVQIFGSFEFLVGKLKSRFQT